MAAKPRFVDLLDEIGELLLLHLRGGLDWQAAKVIKIKRACAHAPDPSKKPPLV